MSKLAFVASFLAAFITMDEQFFGGETTRAVWFGVSDATNVVEKQIHQWTRPIGHH